jgi:hypothetical protein
MKVRIIVIIRVFNFSIVDKGFCQNILMVLKSLWDMVYNLRIEDFLISSANMDLRK